MAVEFKLEMGEKYKSVLMFGFGIVSIVEILLVNPKTILKRASTKILSQKSLLRKR